MAADGPSAVEAVRREHPDIVVLAIMLPGFDGLEVCRRLRQFSDAYVLMLTARTEEVDRVVGLEVGADDYLGSHSVRASLWRAQSEGPGHGATFTFTLPVAP